MENKNTVSIPLVDILSEMLNERVVMSGEDYVIFSNLKKIEKTKIDEALLIKAEKEEDIRVSSINAYTQSFITTKYPLEKQSSANLGIYGEEYKNEMISFISNCINLSNEAIENGASFEDFKAMLNESNINSIVL